MTDRAELRDNVARMLRVRRPVATRVCHWLRLLHEQLDAVHGAVGLVPIRGNAHGVNLLVGTVDYAAHAVGCAWCGLFIADHGEALVDGTRCVTVDPDSLPRELGELELRPAVIYCADCWQALGPTLRDRLDVAGRP